MSVGAVVIGRNEGERLVRCLASLLPECPRVVYVDSGSTDGSVAKARDMGAEVVELDPATPFTAARARNAGAARLLAADPPLLIQFVDGDCEVVKGWLHAAMAALASRPDVALVTGWRREMERDASIYNQMADVEWHRPAGPIVACGGDMLVRASAFQKVGGFDDTVIAAEDDEFCLRLAKAGHGLERLPLNMTRHDMDMHRFSQWWRRSVRNGHGFAQVGAMHPPHLARERQRAWLYGLALPLLAVLGLLVWPWLTLIVALVYLASYIRTAGGLIAGGQPAAEAWRHAGLLTLSKLPNVIGMIRYHLRRARGRAMRIIEYK